MWVKNAHTDPFDSQRLDQVAVLPARGILLEVAKLNADIPKDWSVV